MALYAFDGTWDDAKDSEEAVPTNTNVFRFYDAYRKRSGKNDYYLPGVGTRTSGVGAVLGGVFGLGEGARLDDAYNRLCAQWIAGDTIIDIVGFSRGAATTLDFCHRVMDRGIRQPGSNTVVEASPKIRFLGVWDVVAAFGLANLGDALLNIGHHLSLPKANLQYCFHAMALDERRPSFINTRLPGADEVWFRGVHTDVGGGDGNYGLNDITLKWMFSKAKAAGLPIADEDIAALKPDPTAVPIQPHKLPWGVRMISAVDRRHYTVSPLDGSINPPTTCIVESATDEQTAIELSAMGLQVLPLDQQGRVAAMWATAVAVAKQNSFTLDQPGDAAVRDAMLTLFQGRITLVTNDAQVTTAQEAVSKLVVEMINCARAANFSLFTVFFFNEALFKLPRMYPLTD